MRYNNWGFDTLVDDLAASQFRRTQGNGIIRDAMFSGRITADSYNDKYVRQHIVNLVLCTEDYDGKMRALADADGLKHIYGHVAFGSYPRPGSQSYEQEYVDGCRIDLCCYDYDVLTALDMQNYAKSRGKHFVIEVFLIGKNVPDPDRIHRYIDQLDLSDGAFYLISSFAFRVQ